MLDKPTWFPRGTFGYWDYPGRKKRELTLEDEGNILSLGLSSKENDEVLEALQPHPNLKMFHLKSYRGVETPCWSKSSLIPNLVEFSIVKCGSIKHLPQLGKLPFLKVLLIEGMDALVFIDGDFDGDDKVRVPFPSLKEFTLKKNCLIWKNGRTRTKQDNSLVLPD